MKRGIIAVGLAVASTVGSAATAFADPINGQTVPLAATCTGLGDVTLYQQGPSYTDAFLVGGSTAVVLGPANGAPGLLAEAIAAGTSCTIEGFGTVPVVIVP